MSVPPNRRPDLHVLRQCRLYTAVRTEVRSRHPCGRRREIPPDLIPDLIPAFGRSSQLQYFRTVRPRSTLVARKPWLRTLDPVFPVKSRTASHFAGDFFGVPSVGMGLT